MMVNRSATSGVATGESVSWLLYARDTACRKQLTVTLISKLSGVTVWICPSAVLQEGKLAGVGSTVEVLAQCRLQ